jgi:hypothetical protein
MQADGGVCGGARAGQARDGQAGQRRVRRAARIGEECVALEAGVSTAALGVQDPQLCPATRRPEPIPADNHLGALPDDIPTEPDPRSTGQLQPERC